MTKESPSKFDFAYLEKGTFEFEGPLAFITGSIPPSRLNCIYGVAPFQKVSARLDGSRENLSFALIRSDRDVSLPKL